MESGPGFTTSVGQFYLANLLQNYAQVDESRGHPVATMYAM